MTGDVRCPAVLGFPAPRATLSPWVFSGAPRSRTGEVRSSGTGLMEEDQDSMSRTSKWLPLLAFIAVAAIVFAACSGATTSPSPSSAAPTSGASAPASQPGTSSEPFEGAQYPEDGSSAC